MFNDHDNHLLLEAGIVLQEIHILEYLQAVPHKVPKSAVDTSLQSVQKSSATY